LGSRLRTNYALRATEPPVPFIRSKNFLFSVFYLGTVDVGQ
jgi:hypothetical protein